MQFIHSNKQYIERTMYPINPYVHSNLNETPAILNDGNTSAWFTPCNATTVTKDIDNYVEVVNDISGNSKHLLQSTIEKKPLWTNEGLLFDGINDEMFATTLDIPQPMVIYSVTKELSFSNNGSLFSSLNLPVCVYNGGNKNNLFIYAGGGNSPSDFMYQLNKALIIRARLNGNNTSVQILDRVFTSGNAGGHGIAGLSIGSNRVYGNPPYSNVLYSEIIIRKIQDTPETEQLIYDYLKSKYNL